MFQHWCNNMNVKKFPTNQHNFFSNDNILFLSCLSLRHHLLYLPVNQNAVTNIIKMWQGQRQCQCCQTPLLQWLKLDRLLLLLLLGFWKIKHNKGILLPQVGLGIETWFQSFNSIKIIKKFNVCSPNWFLNKCFTQHNSGYRAVHCHDHTDQNCGFVWFKRC